MPLSRILLLLMLYASGSRCALKDSQRLTHTYPLYHRFKATVLPGEDIHLNRHEGKPYKLKTATRTLDSTLKTEKFHKNIDTLSGSGKERNTITEQNLGNDSEQEIPEKTSKRRLSSQTMASTSSASHSLRKSTMTDTVDDVRDSRLRWMRNQGELTRSPELTRAPLPSPQVCATIERESAVRGTAPPMVCDLCPTTVDNKNPLSPCTCVGNSGTGAGLISITCPPTTSTTDQIHDIFTNTDFITTRVFRFTLRGTNVSGVLSQDLWGDLNFVQVVIVQNMINHVDNKAFINSANSLTLLNLDTNQISEYVTTGVDDLPKLQTLILKRNRLTFIYSHAFNYSSLMLLDLSYNTIDSVGKNAFAALDKLEELYLDHNQLTSLDDDTFYFYNHNPHSNFLQIDLSWNKISYISDDAFRGLRNVQIDLRANQLTTISQKIFYPIILDSQYFAFLAFDGNEIRCDCKLMWIVAEPIVTSCFDNFICADTGIPLYALTPSDLGNCTDSILL